jgi:hypothetical protein
MAYATWNPSDKNAGLVLSNGDLTVTVNGANDRALRATIGQSSRKWYWEITVGTPNNAKDYIGIGTSNASIADGFYLGEDVYGYSYGIDGGTKHHNNSSDAYGDEYLADEIVSIALDMDDGKIWFARQGVWQNSGDPAAGTGEAFSGLSGTFFPMVSMYWNGVYLTANFGASAFSYSVPSGFKSGIYDSIDAEITDGVGLNDQFEVDTPYRDISDSMGMSDQFDAFSLTEEIINGVGVNDALIRSFVVDRSISDGSSIADVMAAILEYQGTITDGSGIADVITPQIIWDAIQTEAMGSDDTPGVYNILNPVLSDTFFQWDDPKWGWAKTIADSMAMADTVEKILGIPIQDWLSLVDTETNTWKGVEALLDGFYIVDIPEAIKFYDELVADGMAIADAVNLALELLITDILTCTDTILNVGKFQQIAEDSMTLEDIARKAFPKTISDSFAATDTNILDILALLQIADTFAITETTTPTLTINQAIADALNAADTATLQQFLFELIQDGFSLEVLIELDDELYECWVLNTGAFHPSVYSGYNFNSFAIDNQTGIVYGCKSDGIYTLEGSTDNGTDFHSGIILPETQFGSAYNKRFRKAYFGVSGDDLAMKMETESGWRTFRIYDAEMSITRDLKGRKWKISLEDFDNLDFLELQPILLSRK